MPGVRPVYLPLERASWEQQGLLGPALTPLSRPGAQEVLRKRSDEQRGWVSLSVFIQASTMVLPGYRFPGRCLKGGLLLFLSWVPSLNWEIFTFIHSPVAKNVYCGLTTCQALFKPLLTSFE